MDFPALPPTPLVKNIILAMIKEELKSHKFFGTLSELGLDDDFYQADLLEYIIPAIGLPPLRSEKSYLFYHDLFKRHSEYVERDAEALHNEALGVYHTLEKYAISHKLAPLGDEGEQTVRPHISKRRSKVANHKKR